MQVTTPIKRGHKTSVTEGATEMKSRLKADLLSHIYSPVSVETFITDIWRVDKTTAESILGANITLPTEPFQSYKNLLSHKKYVENDLHRHRTGTLPFMARDLLRTTVQRHLYRHDLESFFYILIWAAVHYDFKTGLSRHTHDLLKPWLHSTNAAAAGSKASLISGWLLCDLEKVIPPEFKELWTSWMVPLNDMFNEATFQDYKLSRGKITCDIETLGGIITFEKFMAAMGEIQ